jgi:replicative DNA helicase
MSRRDGKPVPTVIPGNTVAEKAVLGALMKDEAAFWRIVDTLRRDHFTLPLHQQIFGAISDICQEGKRLSMTLLMSRLPSSADDGTLMDLYLAMLVKNAEEVQSPLDYADQISEIASRRQLETLAMTVLRQVKAGDRPAIDVAGEAELQLMDVMHASAPKRPRKIGEVVRQTMSASTKANQSDFLPGLTWGLPSLDQLCGLILPGDLWFIIASQGDGKSALAMAPGMKAAGDGKPVLNVQMEMADEQLAARELAKAAGISAGIIREGAYDMFQAEKLEEAARALQAPEMYILDTPGITVRQLGAHCLAMKRSIGLALLIVDQLDKLKSPNRHRDRFERTAELTGDLKNLAKSVGIPVVCLAQRTRTSQRRDDPTPHIDDADAPTIERDGDGVLAVWREENWLRRQKPSGKDPHDIAEWQVKMDKARGRASAILLKQRGRQPFETVELCWDGPLTQFGELGEQKGIDFSKLRPAK